MIFMKIRIFFVLAVLFISSSWYTEPSPLFVGSLLEARQKSSERNVPYLMIFEAEWCSPCQWMEKFTFSDNELVSMMKRDYLAVRMDIDEFEGFALKAQYDIKYLPTILFFNTENKLIGRYENTFGPEAFKSLLRWHKNFKSGNLEGVEVAGAHRAVSSDQERTSVDSKGAAKSKDPMRRPVHQPSTSAQNVVSTPLIAADQTTNTLAGFTIQLGAFGSRENAQKLKRKMEDSGFSPLAIRKISGHRYAYRVTLGNFSTYEQASPMLFELDKQGLKGLVKQLRQFE